VLRSRGLSFGNDRRVQQERKLKGGNRDITESMVGPSRAHSRQGAGADEISSAAVVDDGHGRDPPNRYELAMTEVEQIGEADFAERVLASDMPVLVDFWKSNCAPCRVLARSLEEYAGAVEGVRIVAVNVEESPHVAVMHDVLSVPTLKLFVDGQVVRSFTGPKSVESLTVDLADYA
jgi:thioredoxin 1